MSKQGRAWSNYVKHWKDAPPVSFQPGKNWASTGSEFDTTPSLPSSVLLPSCSGKWAQTLPNIDETLTGTPPKHHKDATRAQAGYHRAAPTGHQRDTTKRRPGHHQDTAGTPPGHNRDTTGTPPGRHRDTTGIPLTRRRNTSGKQVGRQRNTSRNSLQDHRDTNGTHKDITGMPPRDTTRTP